MQLLISTESKLQCALPLNLLMHLLPIQVPLRWGTPDGYAVHSGSHVHTSMTDCPRFQVPMNTAVGTASQLSMSSKGPLFWPFWSPSQPYHQPFWILLKLNQAR
jgi:hypothetical protein